MINDDVLDAVINIRVTRSEKLRLEQSAQLTEHSLSALVRRLILGRTIVAAVDLAMLRELRRQGGLLKMALAAGAERTATMAALKEIENCARRLTSRCDR